MPDPRRDERYFRTGNTVAIRDAVIALASAVLPQTRLVFGGHPAITPMVKWIADQFGLFDNVRLFQSTLFRPLYLADVERFNYIEVEAVGDSREESLLAMRRAMLASERFSAAFFIGGMEGVEDEFELIEELPYRVPRFPVATTGAAAAMLWAARSRTEPPDAWHERLGTSTAYTALFTEILNSL